MNPIAIIQSIAALVIIGLSLPLMMGKIKRNHWYGIRIPEAFRSEERWLEINQYGGRLMLWWGIVIAIAAGIGIMLPKEYWMIYAFSAVAIIFVGLGIIITHILRYAAKTKRT